MRKLISYSKSTAASVIRRGDGSLLHPKAYETPSKPIKDILDTLNKKNPLYQLLFHIYTSDIAVRVALKKELGEDISRRVRMINILNAFLTKSTEKQFQELLSYGLIDYLQHLLDEEGVLQDVKIKNKLSNLALRLFRQGAKDHWITVDMSDVSSCDETACPLTPMPKATSPSGDHKPSISTPVVGSAASPVSPNSIPYGSTELKSAVAIVISEIEKINIAITAHNKILTAYRRIPKTDPAERAELGDSKVTLADMEEISIKDLALLERLVKLGKGGKTITVAKTDRNRFVLSFSGKFLKEEQAWAAPLEFLAQRIKSSMDLEPPDNGSPIFPEGFSFQCAPMNISPFFQSLLKTIIIEFSDHIQKLELAESDKLSEEDLMMLELWASCKESALEGIGHNIQRFFNECVSVKDLDTYHDDMHSYPFTAIHPGYTATVNIEDLCKLKTTLLKRDIMHFSKELRLCYETIKVPPEELRLRIAAANRISSKKDKKAALKPLNVELATLISDRINALFVRIFDKWPNDLLSEQARNRIVSQVKKAIELNSRGTTIAYFNSDWSIDLTTILETEVLPVTEEELISLSKDYHRISSISDSVTDNFIGWRELCLSMIDNITCSESRVWLYYRQITEMVAIGLTGEDKYLRKGCCDPSPFDIAADTTKGPELDVSVDAADPPPEELEEGEHIDPRPPLDKGIWMKSKVGKEYPVWDCCGRSCVPLFPAVYYIVNKLEDVLNLKLDGLRMKPTATGEKVCQNTPGRHQVIAKYADRCTSPCLPLPRVLFLDTEAAGSPVAIPSPPNLLRSTKEALAALLKDE